MSKNVLLFENNGRRVVYDHANHELIFEFVDTDSLGVAHWKHFRNITAMMRDGPGGSHRRNMMFEFLCELFETNSPVPGTLGQVFQEQKGRRLET